MLLYVLTTSKGHVFEFSVRGCAELYRSIYGGNIVEHDEVLTAHLTG